MNNSITQSVAIAINTAAFVALDYSDSLNNLTSRITGGKVNRNTLAESSLHQAATLALATARDNKAVDRYAQSFTGMNGRDFIGHAKNIILSNDQKVFSNSVHQLIKSTLEKQVADGSIPNNFVDSVPEFASEMVNDYIGKKAVYQFLGVYAKNYDWNEITQAVKAQVTDNTSSYRNLLVLSGISVASNLVRSMVNRGIVETMPTGEESTPEVKLAAGCLNAYLSSDRTCESALCDYLPSKAIVDDKFIQIVTDMGVEFSQHTLSQAIDSVREADLLYQKILASGEILNPSYDKRSAHHDGLSSLAELSTPALDAVTEMMHKAKEAYQQAERSVQMNCALKEILVADPKISDEARLSGALRTLLNSVPMHSTLAPILAKALAVDNGLPAQNLVGTFVAIYGWDGLLELLLRAVEKHQENMIDIYSDELSPQKNHEDASWITRAATPFTVKLALAHLKPYINNGNFNKRDNSEYCVIATLIHDNKAAINGDLSAISMGLNSLPAMHVYLNSKLDTIAKNLNDAAASSAGYTATVIQASAIAATAVHALSSQIQEVGLVGTLQSNAVSIGTTTASYACNAAANFAATTRSLFDNMMPSWAARPALMI